VNLKKSSSHELVVQILWHLTNSILGTWFIKFVHKNKICPKMAPLGGASFYIGLYREIHLNRSPSKTIELISTKFGRKHLWGMGIKICKNQGAGTYWGPIRGKIWCILSLLLIYWQSKYCDIWHIASLGHGL